MSFAALALPPTIARLLERTPRHRWNAFVAVVDEEDRTAKLIGRGELAASLTANDLRALASEVLVRRVPPGTILLLQIGREETRLRLVGERPRQPGVPRGRTFPPRSPGAGARP